MNWDEALEEFSGRAYQVHILAALKWKLELYFNDLAAHEALRKAVPDLPYKPYLMGTALSAAAVRRWGGGVIPRDCGDIAILTAKVKTVSEIRQFLREFAVEYLTQRGYDCWPLGGSRGDDPG